MEATDKEIEVYIQNKTANIRSEQGKINEGNRIVRKLTVLRELKDDVESPVIQYLLKDLETRALSHGKKALNGSKIDENFAFTCRCGEKADLHKFYYKVYCDAHDVIVGIVEKWNEENLNIAKASRR